MQVWTILDMHYPDICSSFHWHLCDLHSTQAAEKRMELWHKFGNLVSWNVLWLCHNCTSCIVHNPQILLSSIWPCSVVLSLWILPICLHSCTGKSLVLVYFPFHHKLLAWIIIFYKKNLVFIKKPFPWVNERDFKLIWRFAVKLISLQWQKGENKSQNISGEHFSEAVPVMTHPCPVDYLFFFIGIGGLKQISN